MTFLGIAGSIRADSLAAQLLRLAAEELTEAAEGRFMYTVVAEGGSGYIRSKVFLASLESEREMYASGDPSR